MDDDFGLYSHNIEIDEDSLMDLDTKSFFWMLINRGVQLIQMLIWRVNWMMILGYPLDNMGEIPRNNEGSDLTLGKITISMQNFMYW